MPAPLAGIAVLAHGDSAAVAYAGKLFRDLGAEVTPVRGSVAPDLLPRTHVLLCGSTDDPTALTIDPESIAHDHPHLCIAVISPFGARGEARGRPANDLTLQALGGISLPIGLPGKPPLKLPGNQSAYQAGLVAAIAATGALMSRRGALLDVSAADVWASFYSGVDVALAHFGRYKKTRAGHRVSGQPYPRTILRCKDGYFAIQCGESRHWQAFLRMIGREDLATHPLFANRFKANDEHGDECDALIEPWFLARTKDEILRECLEHKIPGAPVYRMSEVVDHPHLAQRAYFPACNAYASLTRGRGSDPEAPSSRRTRPVDAGDKARPLKGLRVIDFGWVWAGAVPGHVLADLGAEVIKIESASPLDYMRQGRPIVGTQKDPEQNPMFQNVNRGKLSLRIRLDHPDSRALLLDLVGVSDAVIENFSPGVMQKFGLGYEDLKRVRPDVVMCSMSAVGQDGPLRGIRTYATMIASLAGLDGLVAYPGGRVLGSQSSYADPNASLHATLGILAALWRRNRTGQGAYLDLSQWEAAVNVMGEYVSEHLCSGSAPQPRTSREGEKAPHGHYPAAGHDRWIAISAATDVQWQALLAVLEQPAALTAETFSTSSGRVANREALDRLLALETAKHDAEALALRLMASGVQAAPLLDPSGIEASEHYRARALFETVEHPVLGPLPVYRLPWHIDGAPVPLTGRAPLLGEHNEYVLSEVLRYPQERRQALQAAGVFS